MVKSVSEGPLEDASAKGDAAYFYSTYAATSDDEIISIRNTEPVETLHITRILFSTSADARFTLFEATSGTTSGTIKSGVFFGNAAVTGSLTGNSLLSVCVLANTQHDTFLEGSLQLANNDEIAITVTGTSPTVYVTVIGFWYTD